MDEHVWELEDFPGRAAEPNTERLAALRIANVVDAPPVSSSLFPISHSIAAATRLPPCSSGCLKEPPDLQHKSTSALTPASSLLFNYTHLDCPKEVLPFCID